MPGTASGRNLSEMPWKNVGTDLMKIATDKAIAGYEENANKGRLRFLTNYVDGYREGIEYYMDVFGSTGKA